MSVPGYRRKESDLKILKDSQFALISLIRLYKKNELVPKKFSKIVGEPMVENARLLMYSVNEANRCDLYKEYELRKEQQRLIVKYANRILVDLLILSEFNGGNLSKFQKIITAIISIPYTVKKWMKSDKERYDKNQMNMEATKSISIIATESLDNENESSTDAENDDIALNNIVSQIIKNHENDKIDEECDEIIEDAYIAEDLDNELENSQKHKKPTKQMKLVNKLLNFEDDIYCN